MSSIKTIIYVDGISHAFEATIPETPKSTLKDLTTMSLPQAAAEAACSFAFFPGFVFLP
ncbi:MAG: hypothetical protein J6K55_08785 [Clostridia bacterium]|nr:hypothetical protein [Clostridia bacterium]